MDSTLADTNKSLEREIELHEAAIAMHQAAISAAKSKINLLSPISKLPPELMVAMFSFVKTKSTKYDGELPGWIEGVSHVCRHWRDIAINSPSLWNDPPLLNATGMAEMLARSKTVELDIDIVFETHRPTLMYSMIQEIAQHTLRIRKLSIKYIPNIRDDILRIFPTPCDWRLESLRLAGSIQIPDAILINTQGLRRLDLSNCSFDWDLLNHRNLIHLRLFSIKPGTLLTLAKLMGKLGKMAALESLFLFNAFDLSAGSISDHVHFANLKSLYVYSQFPEVEALFRSITFPRSAQVKITAVVSREEDIPPFLATVIGSRSKTPNTDVLYRTLEIKEERRFNSTNIQLTLYRDTLEQCTPFSMWKLFGQGHFSLSLDWQDRHAPDSAAARVRVALASFLSSDLPLGQVSHVYLQSDIADVSIDPETLVSTIERLPAASFIGTTGGMNSSLTRALQHQTTDPEGGPTCFSKLTAIALCRSAHNLGSLDEDLGGFDFGSLEESLSRLYKWNSGIKSLLLERHGDSITDEDLVRLRQIVEHVEFL